MLRRHARKDSRCGFLHRCAPCLSTGGVIHRQISVRGTKPHNVYDSFQAAQPLPGPTPRARPGHTVARVPRPLSKHKPLEPRASDSSPCMQTAMEERMPALGLLVPDEDISFNRRQGALDCDPRAPSPTQVQPKLLLLSSSHTAQPPRMRTQRHASSSLAEPLRPSLHHLSRPEMAPSKALPHPNDLTLPSPALPYLPGVPSLPHFLSRVT